MRATAGRRLVGAIAAPAALLVVQIVLFPMPAGVYVQGLTLGLLAALVSVGLCLVYRANRIINFSQSALGLVPTVIAVDLIVYSHMSFTVAGLVGAALSVVLGVAVYAAVIKRFASSSRLILTVATIGIAQACLGLSLMIPKLWGHDIRGAVHLERLVIRSHCGPARLRRGAPARMDRGARRAGARCGTAPPNTSRDRGARRGRSIGPCCDARHPRGPAPDARVGGRRVVVVRRCVPARRHRRTSLGVDRVLHVLAHGACRSHARAIHPPWPGGDERDRPRRSRAGDHLEPPGEPGSLCRRAGCGDLRRTGGNGEAPHPPRPGSHLGVAGGGPTAGVAREHRPTGPPCGSLASWPGSSCSRWRSTSLDTWAAAIS